MEGVDAVINLVAVIREHGDATFERLNYQGTINVLDAARQAGVGRLIQMSAIGAGNLPEFPYHYTKWRAENAIKDTDLRWTIFRPSIVFGPGEKFQFLSALADLVRQAPVIPVVGDGRSRFQPVHVNDVSDAFERALRDPATTTGQTYELAGPEVVTYEEILDAVAAALGKHKRKVHIPVSLMMPAAAAMNAIPFINAPVTTDQLKMLKLDNTTDHNAVPNLTGHQPIPFHGNIGYIAGDTQAPVAPTAERSVS
jgi:NADH dehydrogenase